jgi:hypothetical protein
MVVVQALLHHMPIPAGTPSDQLFNFGTKAAVSSAHLQALIAKPGALTNY